MKKWIIGIILLGTISAADGERKKHKDDAFACTSDTFSLQSFEKGAASISPDGKNKIELRKGYTGIHLISNGRELEFNPCGFSANLEVAWSPDSTKFAMQCGESSYNGFTVTLFQIVNGRVLQSDVPSTVLKDFSAKHSCPARDPHNMFFLAWTADSERAFLISEVSPTGDCVQGGEFAGFLVDIRTGKIIRRFGEHQTTQIEKSCRASGVLKIPKN